MDKKVAIVIIAVVLVGAIIGGNLIAKNMRAKTGTITQRESKMEDEVSQIFNEDKVTTKINGTKQLDSLEITNIQLADRSGKGKISFDVINKDTKKSSETLANIILYDEKGKELETVPVEIPELESGKSAHLTIMIEANYMNVNDLKIIKK